jgi:hypothetical protein
MTMLDRIAFTVTGLVLLGLAVAFGWAVLALWPVVRALTGH